MSIYILSKFEYIVTSVTVPQFLCQFIAFCITLGRNREGGKVKEEGISERDVGSEREINPPTLVEAVHSSEGKCSRCWCRALGWAVKVKKE